MKRILAGILILCLGGCVTTRTMNRLELGMSKSQVVKILGTPKYVAAQEKTEYLIFDLSPYDVDMGFHNQEYFVKLVDGTVESYGKKGDMGSTAAPTQNININEKKDISGALTIKQE